MLKTSDAVNSAIWTPLNYKHEAIGIVAYDNSDREARIEKLRGVAEYSFSDGNVHSCLVIGVNIDENDYPYSVLGAFHRN